MEARCSGKQSGASTQLCPQYTPTSVPTPPLVMQPSSDEVPAQVVLPTPHSEKKGLPNAGSEDRAVPLKVPKGIRDTTKRVLGSPELPNREGSSGTVAPTALRRSSRVVKPPDKLNL